MTAQILANIFVCDDCLFVHANGEASDDPDYTPDREPWNLAPCADVAINCETYGDDDEPDCGFSWSACDACGSALGGTRHRMAVFGWGE